MVRKRSAIPITILTLIFVFFVSFVVAGVDKKDEAKDEISQTIFKVENLSCGGCLNNIDGALQKKEGMVEMAADLPLGLIAVRHTDKLTDDAIAKTMTETGYPAKAITYEQYQAMSGKAKGQNSQASGGCGGGCRGCGSAPQTAQIKPEGKAKQ